MASTTRSPWRSAACRKAGLAAGEAQEVEDAHVDDERDAPTVRNRTTSRASRRAAGGRPTTPTTLSLGGRTGPPVTPCLQSRAESPSHPARRRGGRRWSTSPWTDEHEALRDRCGSSPPRSSRRRSASSTSGTCSPSTSSRQMGAMGLFGLPFPEEHGGMGGDYFALCLAIEELARVDSSVAITLEAAVSLGAMPLHRFGSRGAQGPLAAAAARGEALGAFGLTEPGGGYGRGRDPDDRPARRRRHHLGDQRHQGVHHQLRHRLTGVRHRDRGDRRPPGRPQGDLDDPRAVRHPGLHGRAVVLQGRLALLGHPRAGLRRLPGPGRATSSASGAAATRSSCRSSTRAASPSRRWPWGSPRAASTSR